ncbi:zinc dependent phospholipase C family protein [Papillibacter cinnamivorans]|uniref:zinc dependent phospholipase C family protein n=1 Tax=Papillibacter cinnamivorans TaxID=100176 RepID=UPI0013566DE7|nr:zinc dependent phospholipase C family protein [Papillibacter cinnamivorans]
MNTLSHIAVGSLVCTYLAEHHEIRLSRMSFLLGNIIPDFRPSFLSRPHYLAQSIGYVTGEMEALASQPLSSAEIGSEYSKRLGVVCHYYADFFCHAHSGRMKKGLLAHVLYEYSLYKYGRKRAEVLGRIPYLQSGEVAGNLEALIRKLEAYHRFYLDAVPSPGQDLVCANQACAEAAAALVRCSCRLRVPESAEYPACKTAAAF